MFFSKKYYATYYFPNLEFNAKLFKFSFKDVEVI